MWTKPWNMKEGLAIAIGLAVTGLLLQLSVGPVVWDLFAWPTNLVTAIVFVFLLVVGYTLRQKVYFFTFAHQPAAAVPAIAMAMVMTIIMGLVRQRNTPDPADVLGLGNMLSFWPFVLSWLWTMIVVGMTTIHQFCHFRKRMIPSLISHLGLFLVVVCGTLGHADMQKLKMYCEEGNPEWRGLTEQSDVVELPLAIQLDKFIMEEWPAKLMIINKDGRPIPEEKPWQLSLDDGVKQGELGEWKIEIKESFAGAIPHAMLKMMSGVPEGMMAHMRMDSLGMARAGDNFVKSNVDGASPAAYVVVSRGGSVPAKPIMKGGGKRAFEKYEGWVTCGSYKAPFKTVKLAEGMELAMSNPEPSRYASKVTVVTQDGVHEHAEISVNHPLHVAGWDVYQYSYNQQMGKWSKLSVFELVSDPWLPVVYAGLYLLLAGAVLTFITSSRRNKA